MFHKSNPRRGPEAEQFYKDWSASHYFCFACGVPCGRAAWPGLSTHHLIKQGRSHEACNFLRLCHQCHRLAEGDQIRQNGLLLPKLPLSVCLTVKRFRDPDVWWPERLAQLYLKPLPELEPLPWFFEDQFRKWQKRNPALFFDPDRP